MKSENIKNNEGVVLQTKDEKTMQNHTFEAEDVFIPQYNTYLEKSHEAEVKGKMKTITERKLVCKVNGPVRDESGEIIGYEPCKDVNGEEKLFVILTPTQAKAFDKAKKNGVEPNQIVWRAYEYKNDFGDQVGIGPKVDFKEAISFEDAIVADEE